jgi:hypothetical protein
MPELGVESGTPSLVSAVGCAVGFYPLELSCGAV